MRLAEIATLNRIADERARLIDQRAQIHNGRGLALSFNGSHLEEAMLELIRPVVIGHPSGRIRALEADLATLGVDLA